MKNHVRVNGRLLQTNKTWSHLKERQKVLIAELLRSEYIRLTQELEHPPQKDKYEIILNRVYAQNRGARNMDTIWRSETLFLFQS